MDYDIIEYHGDIFIAMDWNGERYARCYKRAEFGGAFPADGWENKDIALRPIYKEVADEFEVIGYEEV